MLLHSKWFDKCLQVASGFGRFYSCWTSICVLAEDSCFFTVSVIRCRTGQWFVFLYLYKLWGIIITNDKLLPSWNLFHTFLPWELLRVPEPLVLQGCEDTIQQCLKMDQDFFVFQLSSFLLSRSISGVVIVNLDFNALKIWREKVLKHIFCLKSFKFLELCIVLCV